MLAWIEPVSTVITGAALVSEVAKSSNAIRKHWARIVYWVRHGSLSIPIFGAGGVGKSTLALIIAGSDPLDVVAPYDESWTTEAVDLTGDVPGKLLVGPGQEERVERHWPQLFNTINTGKAIGLVNVVSYGFHSIGIPTIREHDLWQDGMDNGAFSRAYTARRRLLEIELARKVISGLAGADKPLWMLTVVNKQDLWWSVRGDVKKHYTEGDYAKVVLDLQKSIGPRNFQHEFLPVSLTLGNFCSPAGEMLSPTCAGYDHSIHLRYLDQLFGRFYELGVEKDGRS